MSLKPILPLLSVLTHFDFPLGTPKFWVACARIPLVLPPYRVLTYLSLFSRLGRGSAGHPPGKKKKKKKAFIFYFSMAHPQYDGQNFQHHPPYSAPGFNPYVHLIFGFCAPERDPGYMTPRSLKVL